MFGADLTMEKICSIIREKIRIIEKHVQIHHCDSHDMWIVETMPENASTIRKPIEFKWHKIASGGDLHDFTSPKGFIGCIKV